MDNRYVDVHTTFTFANEERARKVKQSALLSVMPVLPPLDEPDKIDHGNIIAMHRIAKRLKQDELAQKMYVKIADIKSWEMNKSVPSRKQMQDLGRILDCSFSLDIN